jgi:branched-subunit amino acid transport protein
MMKMDSATWAIVVAFIVLGLLMEYQSAWGGWNYVIAGVVAFLVSWAGMAGMKK